MKTENENLIQLWKEMLAIMNNMFEQREYLSEYPKISIESKLNQSEYDKFIAKANEILLAIGYNPISEEAKNNLSFTEIVIQRLEPARKELIERGVKIEDLTYKSYEQ